MFGGCLGAVSRYGVNLLAARLWGSGFPWGTLIVNMVGCFLIGLVFGLAERMAWLTPSVRLFFVTGFLGALTTFSSFAVETVNIANAGFRSLAGINFVANNAGGLVLVLVGLWLAKVL
ncbi:MAG TPA: fluoride efflux transporter CrcB [Sedimentisphaerales bacterium]|nr:fluoride efflux transporter CrcB [Sedimentisphaerales bacterium]